MRVPLWPLLLVVAFPVPVRAERFKYRFTPGRVFRYRGSLAGATIAGQAGGQMIRSQFRVVSRQVQQVRSLENGVATLAITDTPVSGTQTSMGQTRPYSQKVIRMALRITERGKFRSRKTEGEKVDDFSPLDGLDPLYGLNFPDRDLKPGDRWEDTFKTGDASTPMEVHVATRYVGKETFRGRSCARFSTRLVMEMSDSAAGESAGESGSARGKLTATVTTYFDPELGTEAYSSGTITLLMRAEVRSEDLGGGQSVEGMEFATVTRINSVQTLVSAGSK